MPKQKTRKDLIKELTCDELEVEEKKMDCKKNHECDLDLKEDIEDIKFKKCRR